MNTRLDKPPPAPEKIPYTLEVHGDKRIDNYYWLRDDSRSDKKVLDYLKTENQYADNWFKLRKDYKSRLKIFKKLSFRFLLLLLALVAVAAVYAPLRVYFLEQSYVGKWLGCSTEELQEKQSAETNLQPGSNAELADFIKDRAINRIIEGREAKTEISYLEKVAPIEVQQLENPSKNKIKLSKSEQK